MTSIQSHLGADYYRSRLSSQGRTFYDTLLSQLQGKNYSGQSSLKIHNSTTASADCFSAYKAIRDDHPEFFFLGYEARFMQCGHMGRISYPLLYSAKNIQRVELQMRKHIRELVRGTFGLSTIEAETLVYERIASQINYTNHDDVRDHNIVGPVLFRSGVCEGYTALLILCLRRLGIPCFKAQGFTKEGTPHCWAIVWVEGHPVHCDVTWDRSNEDGIVAYNYLNLSDRQISSDHRWSQDGSYPACLSEEFTFYRQHGLCVHSRTDLIRRIKEAGHISSPLLLHIDYIPFGANLANEVHSTLRRLVYFPSVNIHTYPAVGNIIITRNH